METTYNIFADVVDPKAQDQFDSAMAQPSVVAGALMPDVHAGYSLPIGSVVVTNGFIYPSWVGYDIGCGMCAVPTTFERTAVETFAKQIYSAIYQAVPVGFRHSNEDAYWGHNIECTSVAGNYFNSGGLRQLGTLGGGNHFIEIGYDESDKVWVIVHSGSRGIGHSVAGHYMALASGDGKAREGHFGFRTDSQEGKDYILDLNFMLQFALTNRRLIIRKVLTQIARYCAGYGEADQLINRNHNHAENVTVLPTWHSGVVRGDFWIHRKGATHAEEGMLGVIPGNMRDGSFIVRGKGNPAALWSSSHGAGRIRGRKQSERELTMAAFETTMQGITANVSKETLDESPDAYKDIFAVMAQQSELVEVLHYVKPLINIKG